MVEKSGKYERNKVYDELFDLIVDKKIMNRKDAEAWCYALKEIEESIAKIKSQTILVLFKRNDDIDKIKNYLWEIREECRHIDYHIKDGKLTD